jgi:hypothetical protein
VPQNQVDFDLWVVPQNRSEDEDGIGYASRSSGLFQLEASRARVSQFGLKTGRGIAWMVHVTSSRRLRGDEVEDEWVDAMGYILLFYPTLLFSLY